LYLHLEIWSCIFVRIQARYKWIVRRHEAWKKIITILTLMVASWKESVPMGRLRYWAFSLSQICSIVDQDLRHQCHER
jgi:hypothetical protein